ncbi:hypothetical protein LUZ60_005254 [Juncus effusus]|nr:hypothetical protein LUZ60_005254 [Juncus effusus]
MGKRKSKLYRKPSIRDFRDEDPAVSDLRAKHRLDRDNLTLTTQPIKTILYFSLATAEYLKSSAIYLIRHCALLIFFSFLLVAIISSLFILDGPHKKHVKEILNYASFSLWWIALGVASSIGLGSGLHTFVLYLGPHIAFFTIKALQCGRVDLKSAPYDTIQLNAGPSWLEKECSEFGFPLFETVTDSLVKIPLGKILPQIQLEAVLWGLGTALGELPPYFISRAASLSGSKLEAMEEFEPGPSEKLSGFSAKLDKAKRWLFSKSQHLNFFTILTLASVPNPLFDLAGIMCGQFGVPFWKFFFATLIGKAIIKTHIQTVFIIALINNQLLELVENRLIWAFGHIPFLANILPSMINKLHSVKEKYLSSPGPSPINSSPVKGKKWRFSFNTIWNTVVWLMLVNFFGKIVTSTAQNYLKKQQETELNNRKKSLARNGSFSRANGSNSNSATSDYDSK